MNSKIFKELFESEQISTYSVPLEIKTTSLCYFYIRSKRESKLNLIAGKPFTVDCLSYFILLVTLFNPFNTYTICI